jgi:hypothetical protein
MDGTVCRGRDAERSRVGLIRALTGASWMALLVTGLALFWWMSFLLAMAVLAAAGAEGVDVARDTWTFLAPLGLGAMALTTVRCGALTGFRWSPASVIGALALACLAAAAYGAITVAPFAVLAAALMTRRTPRLTAAWRFRYGLLAASCVWSTGLPVAVALLLSDDARGGDAVVLISPPALAAYFIVGWALASVALLYAATPTDAPRNRAFLAAGVCATAVLAYALVDLPGVDIAIAFGVGMMVSPPLRTYGAPEPGACRYLAPRA